MMKKNRFDQIMDWDYHPHVLLFLGFMVGYYLTDDDFSLAALIASAIAMPLIALILFIPYLVIVWVVAGIVARFPAN